MKIEIPTAEEDAIITTAALSDPDNPPLTDEELAQFKRQVGQPSRHMMECEPSLLALDAAIAHGVADSEAGRVQDIETVREALRRQFDVTVQS
ncbi:MAG: hypothetical protein H7833_11725 [Magnetococcus sp. DMHC-1]